MARFAKFMTTSALGAAMSMSAIAQQAKAPSNQQASNHTPAKPELAQSSSSATSTQVISNKHVIVKIHGYDYDCTQKKVDYTTGPESGITTSNDITGYNKVCSALTGPLPFI